MPIFYGLTILPQALILNIDQGLQALIFSLDFCCFPQGIPIYSVIHETAIRSSLNQNKKNQCLNMVCWTVLYNDEQKLPWWEKRKDRPQKDLKGRVRPKMTWMAEMKDVWGFVDMNEWTKIYTWMIIGTKLLIYAADFFIGLKTLTLLLLVFKQGSNFILYLLK